MICMLLRRSSDDSYAVKKKRSSDESISLSLSLSLGSAGTGRWEQAVVRANEEVAGCGLPMSGSEEVPIASH